MTLEDQHTDRKSLRTVTGKTADWDALAKDCVCFANGAGGRLLVGIEDDEALPPAGQAVPPDLLDRLRKRMGELTVNVQALPSLQRAANGGEFIELVIDRSASVASTRDGRYFLRVADTCQPVLGDDVLRLANERPGRPWEAMDSGVPRGLADTDKLAHFVQGIRSSDRVKESVKEKSADELLTHYGLAQGATLTRLGVLLLGTTADRRALGHRAAGAGDQVRRAGAKDQQVGVGRLCAVARRAGGRRLARVAGFPRELRGGRGLVPAQRARL